MTYTSVGSLKEVKAYGDWVRNGILQNKPYDRMARERIAAQGYAAPTRHFFRYTELVVPHEIMAEQVRVFMGRRLDCAQCHNHPFETWSQDQFWGMTAFFGNVTQLLDSQLVFDNPEGGRSYDLKREGIKTVHPRRKEEVRAGFLDGSFPTGEQERDPRLALARLDHRPARLRPDRREPGLGLFLRPWNRGPGGRLQGVQPADPS